MLDEPEIVAFRLDPVGTKVHDQSLVLVDGRSQGLAHDHLNSQLLVEFTDEGLDVGFPRLHLSSRKLKLHVWFPALKQGNLRSTGTLPQEHSTNHGHGWLHQDAFACRWHWSMKFKNSLRWA